MDEQTAALEWPELTRDPAGHAHSVFWEDRTASRERNDLVPLQSLTSETTEAPWLEFKERKAEPQLVSEYVSALANAARSRATGYAYMVGASGTRIT